MTTLVERLNRWRFRRAVTAMLQAPAARLGGADFTALSMVHHRDVLPYLLAIKSFVLHAKPARVVVVADPTLDETDRATLIRHVPGLEILEASRFRRSALPIGGTWERLSAISVLCGETSVVQLDADTVTFAPPSEVVEAAVGGRSFVIRSEAGVEIVPLESAAELGRVLLRSSSHVQPAAEARLAELRGADRLRYVRGCSGFTGFGRGAMTPELLDDVSAQMRVLLGNRWDEWGTEQVTSNLMAASVSGAFMLPHPRYCNADALSPETVLAHYIGYARYVSRDYERRIGAAVRQMEAAARAGG